MVTTLHPIMEQALAPFTQYLPGHKPPGNLPKKVVHHINGNIYDNRPENLKSVDPKENLRDTQ